MAAAMREPNETPAATLAGEGEKALLQESPCQVSIHVPLFA
jgi:hypothetical protein